MNQIHTPLSKDAVIAIHTITIQRFGGTDGIRDEQLLDSALAQPFQTFDGDELYPTIAGKAARYAFGISANHPFIDGNKRTAAAVLGAFLRLNRAQFKPRHADLLNAMMGIADGSLSCKELEAWIEKELRG